MGVAIVALGAGCAREEPAPLGRLAFVRGDTLYAQALPSGSAHIVAVGRGLAQPRWSPTGAWLAFHLGAELRVMPVAGTGGQKLAAQAGDFAWAPTDDRLAYVAEGNLIVARPGGVGVVLAARAKEGSVEGVAWSPDGTRIAFGLRPGAGAVPRLWAIPARGGPATALALPDSGAGPPLVRGWMAAGHVLALLPRGDLRTAPETKGLPLYAVPVQGSRAARLLADSVLPYPEFVAPDPGGGAVALVRGGGPETWRAKAIVVVQAAGGAAAAVSEPGRAAISPAWAPDARRLAWVEMPEAALPGGTEANISLGGRRIVIADVPGRGAARLLGGAPGRQEYPRWAADARHLLFVGIDSAGAASVWLAAEGVSPVRVLDSLAPPPGASDWSGLYGHVAWGDVIDYWAGPPARR